MSDTRIGGIAVLTPHHRETVFTVDTGDLQVYSTTCENFMWKNGLIRVGKTNFSKKLRLHEHIPFSESYHTSFHKAQDYIRETEHAVKCLSLPRRNCSASSILQPIVCFLNFIPCNSSRDLALNYNRPSTSCGSRASLLRFEDRSASVRSLLCRRPASQPAGIRTKSDVPRETIPETIACVSPPSPRVPAEPTEARTSESAQPVPVCPLVEKAIEETHVPPPTEVPNELPTKDDSLSLMISPAPEPDYIESFMIKLKNLVVSCDKNVQYRDNKGGDDITYSL